MELLVSLLPFVAIFGIFWFLVIRPANKRQRNLAEVQRSLEIGDTVITSSGFFGSVRTIAEDKIGLEIAEGVVVQVARGAVVGHPDGEEQPRAAQGAAQDAHDPDAFDSDSFDRDSDEQLSDERADRPADDPEQGR